MNMNGIKRKFVLIMALLIVFSAFAPFSVQKAEAGSKYYLPTKVTYYKYKKGKWVKDWSESIKYNKKGYVLESKFKQGKQTEKYKYKYSYYKNGKLKKKKLPGGESYIFNKEGRMTEYRLSSGKVFEKYKYKGSRLVKFYDGDCWFKLTYTEHQDGSIARIETRIPGDPLDVEPKRWSEVDENGLLTKEGDKDSDYETSYKYSLDKKGRVSSVIECRGKRKCYKTVFSYSKAPTTTKKYIYNYQINSSVGYLNEGMRAASCEGLID